jgi:exopolyphosphatase/guanosine-5'-triphosphate,3'-diphosphate pyrophosphatase
MRRRRHSPEFCAALDLGTNNCRLLIARPSSDGFRIVDAFSRIVCLGEGLEETGRLSEEAMTRAIDALGVCASKLRRRKVSNGRYVATAACRKADNNQDFLDRAYSQTGIRIETISPREEARLTLAGCLPLIDAATRNVLVFDIGGGSTELMWLESGSAGAEMVDWTSLPFGVVTLTERYGQGPFADEPYRAMIEELDSHLAPFCERHAITERVRGGGVQMLGSSGTVTTLTGLSLELARYDRSRVDGAFLRFDAVHEISGRLRGMTTAERAAHSCIGSDRADMMVAGCAILEAICRRWPVGRLRVADRGVREGILADLMGRGSQGANGA